MSTLKKIITADIITEMVAMHFGLSPDDVRGRKRDQQTAKARRVAVYLIKKLTKNTYTETGEYFSKDHAFILFVYGKAIKQIMEDSEFRDCIHQITEKLQEYAYS